MTYLEYRYLRVEHKDATNVEKMLNALGCQGYVVGCCCENQAKTALLYTLAREMTPEAAGQRRLEFGIDKPKVKKETAMAG